MDDSLSVLTTLDRIRFSPRSLSNLTNNTLCKSLLSHLPGLWRRWGRIWRRAVLARRRLGNVFSGRPFPSPPAGSSWRSFGCGVSYPSGPLWLYSLTLRRPHRRPRCPLRRSRRGSSRWWTRHRRLSGWSATSGAPVRPVGWGQTTEEEGTTMIPPSLISKPNQVIGGQAG